MIATTMQLDPKQIHEDLLNSLSNLRIEIASKYKNKEEDDISITPISMRQATVTASDSNSKKIERTESGTVSNECYGNVQNEPLYSLLDSQLDQTQSPLPEKSLPIISEEPTEIIPLDQSRKFSFHFSF